MIIEVPSLGKEISEQTFGWMMVLRQILFFNFFAKRILLGSWNSRCGAACVMVCQLFHIRGPFRRLLQNLHSESCETNLFKAKFRSLPYSEYGGGWLLAVLAHQSPPHHHRIHHCFPQLPAALLLQQSSCLLCCCSPPPPPSLRARGNRIMR